MRPEEVYPRQADVQLVDVRERAEWDAGHIAGAVHIPMGELGARQQELARDRPIIAVCRSGNRSAQVVRALRDAGYDAENLDGGMQAWTAADLPYVADDGGVPRVA